MGDDRRPVSVRRRLALAGALALACPAARSNAAWPRRLALVVPQAPGGTADLVARVLAERIEASPGVPVAVENRPGANGVIANEFVSRAAADGSTLLIASSGTHAMAPHLLPRGGGDPSLDFAAVAPLALQTKLFLVPSGLPVTSVREFVEYVHERPGRLNYGSVGVATSSHVDSELFARLAGLSLVHVPYRGSVQAMQALAVGEVHLQLASFTPALPLVESGQVRALAVLADRRSPRLPRVPTLAESGWPLFDVRTWLGVVAPRATPGEVVAAWHEAIARVVASPAVVAWMHGQGLEPLAGTPAQFAGTMSADYDKWGRVIRDLGLAPV